MNSWPQVREQSGRHGYRRRNRVEFSSEWQDALALAMRQSKREGYIEQNTPQNINQGGCQ